MGWASGARTVEGAAGPAVQTRQMVEGWAAALAATRLEPPAEAGAGPASAVAIDSDGRTTSALLTCPVPVGSSAVVANLLLQEFSAGARPSRLGLSQSVKVEVVSSRGGSDGGRPRDAEQGAVGCGCSSSSNGAVCPEQQQQLVVRFTTAGGDAEAAEQVRCCSLLGLRGAILAGHQYANCIEYRIPSSLSALALCVQVSSVAAAFEAHLHHHATGAKSSVHTRMRQRLVTLRQQLSLARHPAPADPLIA